MADHPVRRFAPLVSALAGGVLAFFLTDRNLVISAVVFFVLLIGIRVAITPRSNPAGELVADGISKLDLETTLREARAKLVVIQNEAFKITSPEARRKVDAIGDVISRIIDDVKQDPKDLKNARQFFAYYLDATVKVIKYYVDISGKPGSDPEMIASAARVEAELNTIRAAYEKLLKQLSDNDLMDLDIELTVLKRTIELEGLGEAQHETNARRKAAEASQEGERQ